jgi:hypothetical protein
VTAATRTGFFIEDGYCCEESADGGMGSVVGI